MNLKKHLCRIGLLFLVFACNKQQEVIEYWANGQPKVVKIPTYDGDLFEYYDEKGSKEREGLLAIDRKEKLWTYYYPSGVQRAKITYRDDKKFGLAQTFYPNGQLQSRGAYNEFEKEQGPWQYFYENGAIHKSGHFENGKRAKTWKEYEASGEMVKEDQYLNPDVLLVSKTYLDDQIFYEERYRSGLVKAEGPTTVEGEKAGEWRFFHENGQLNGAGKYKHDQKIGKWTYWYPNGVKMAEGHYFENSYDPSLPHTIKNRKLYELPLDPFERDGLKNGVWTFWKKNENLKAKVSFEMREKNYYAQIIVFRE